MKLGKRYIPLVDGSPGPPWLLEHPSPSASFTYLTVDLDSLPPADASEYEQHEYQFSYHWARCQELRPDANPEDAVARELVRLRAENQRMARLCEAACRWNDGAAPISGDALSAECDRFLADKPAEPTHAEPRECELPGVCPDCGCRECADCDRCADHLQERRRYGHPVPANPAVTPGTLTAAERAALRELRRLIERNPIGWSPYDSGIGNTLVSAFDKLLAANGVQP